MWKSRYQGTNFCQAFLGKVSRSWQKFAPWYLLFHNVGDSETYIQFVTYRRDSIFNFIFDYNNIENALIRRIGNEPKPQYLNETRTLFSHRVQGEYINRYSKIINTQNTQK